MNALVWLGPREMALRETALPRLPADHVRLKVQAVGICGSELSGYLGKNSLRVPPLVMGHEFSGVVEEIGAAVADVADVAVGDRVVVNPLLTCGECGYCLSGHENLCQQR
ncbi:MAG TPA: alcohol dehydrogenase catalytic domain-containing protein, partial [Trueperaceae bacterium]|nr:alcohol dehydrogenase catalytic domain-containing protein [Trueperaceae bacterium]